jgi:hypothetical protein
MSEKKGIDLENLKFIDASEVPAKVRYTPYRELLKRIHKGKALVLSSKEVNINTVRAGIQRVQRHGDFKRIVTMQRRLESGEEVLYVVNPPDELATPEGGTVFRRRKRIEEPDMTRTERSTE